MKLTDVKGAINFYRCFVHIHIQLFRTVHYTRLLAPSTFLLPAAVSRCIFESGSNFFAQYLNARQKNAPHSAAIKETDVHTATKGRTRSGKVRRSEKEREREEKKETRERFYRPLMPFHPLPLFCGRNTKNLTFPSSAPPVPRFSPPALTLQSFRSCYVLFSFPASRAIFPRSGRCDVVVPRDKFLQPGTCERRAPTGTGYLEGINPISSRGTDPNLYFPFVFSFPFLSRRFIPSFLS